MKLCRNLKKFQEHFEGGKTESLLAGLRPASSGHSVLPAVRTFRLCSLGNCLVRAFRMCFPVFRFRAFPWDTAGGQLGCPSPWRLGHNARPLTKKIYDFAGECLRHVPFFARIASKGIRRKDEKKRRKFWPTQL